MRAADADRDRVAERLRTAAGEGRLSPEELESRLETAFGATTYAELETVVADLPRPVSTRPARRSPDFAPFLATSALLLVIWALTGMGYFWPLWPIVGWGLFVVPWGGRVRLCRRGSFNRACSTARWRSSAAGDRV